MSYKRILELTKQLKSLSEQVEKLVNEKLEVHEFNRMKKLAGVIESAKKVDEKWGKPTKVAPSEKGKYKGKSLEDLRSSLANLKKSGPHKKGSPEYGRMKELQFAIRAKTGWGKVGKEE